VSEALRDAKLALMKDLRADKDAATYDALAAVSGQPRRRRCLAAGTTWAVKKERLLLPKAGLWRCPSASQFSCSFAAPSLDL
jgi:hypothetical protein